MKIVNLNKNASALVGENGKVRVRVLGGILQIRPTNRVLGRNLPKGEMLADLKVRADRGTVRFQLPEVDGLHVEDSTVGNNFILSVGRHGWLSLNNTLGVKIPTKIGEAAPAGASLTAK